jgi:heptosyltransferase-1
MRVLIVKLSSLGDVVHTLPVVADIRAAHPGARVDWIVEPAFAPLVERVDGIANVIECALRRWTREGWLRATTRGEAKEFVRRLRRDRYDAVVELQGLTKAAIVAALARGPSWGLANRTDGASHEWPARVLATHAVRVEQHSHALDRAR